jgi:hypothetical protein
MQWGSSNITKNTDAAVDSAYVAPSNTMAEWGAYLIEGMPKAPEFGYYVDQTKETNGTKPVYLNQT